MWTTRSSKTTCPIPVIPSDAPLAVRKLALGGRDGQYTSCISQQKDEEVRDSNAWNFLQPTRSDSSVLPHIPKNISPDPIMLCVPCGSPPPPPVTVPNISTKEDGEYGNAFVNLDRLGKAVEENIICKSCSEKYYRERKIKFHKYCDTYRQQKYEEVMLSGRTQEQKIIALSDIISYKTNKLWQSFAHSKLDLECKRREK